MNLWLISDKSVYKRRGSLHFAFTVTYVTSDSQWMHRQCVLVPLGCVQANQWANRRGADESCDPALPVNRRVPYTLFIRRQTTVHLYLSSALWLRCKAPTARRISKNKENKKQTKKHVVICYLTERETKLVKKRRDNCSCVTECNATHQLSRSGGLPDPLQRYTVWKQKKQNENQIHQRGFLFTLHVAWSTGDWERPAGPARHRGELQGAEPTGPARPGHQAQGLSVVPRVPPWKLENPLWRRLPHHRHKVLCPSK